MELASFPCSYSTAENLLSRANVRQGQHVLVTGASGGVGSAAVQLALARGAELRTLLVPATGSEIYVPEVDRLFRSGLPHARRVVAAILKVVFAVDFDIFPGELLPDPFQARCRSG